MLSLLLRRLSSPLVASVVTKEQLCLSLASVAQLFPVQHGAQVARVPTPASSAPVMSDTDVAALAARAGRLAPSCSPKEIGMIASGSASLCWSRPRLVDALAKGLLWHCESGPAATAPRLGDLVHVLNAAIAAEHYHSATLVRLVLHFAPQTMARSLTEKNAATVHEFVAASHVFLGGDVGRMTRLLTSMRHGAGVAAVPSDKDYAALAATLSTSPLFLKRQRVFAEESISSSSNNSSNGEPRGEPAAPATGEAERLARRCVAMAVEDATAALASQLSADDVAERIQLLAHYRICDPVAQTALETAAEKLLLPSSSATASERQYLTNTVYASSHLFQRLCSVLQSGPAAVAAEGSQGCISASSLQRVGAAAAAFRRMIRGEKLEEAVLLRITEELDNCSPDEMAMAAAVFAFQKEVPREVAAALLGATPQMTIVGVAALVWAARKDQNGRVLAAAESAMSRLDEAMLDGVPTETLAALLVAIRLPQPRQVSPSASFAAAEKRARAAAADHVLELVLVRPEQSLPLPRLLALARCSLGVCETNEAVRLLCDRVAKLARPLTPQEAVLSLTLLCDWQEIDDSFHETLIDRVAECCKSLVVRVCAEGDDSAQEETHTQQAQALLDCVQLQVRLDCPELEPSSATLLHHTETLLLQPAAGASTEGMATRSVEALTAVGLLSGRTKRHSLHRAVLAALTRILQERSAAGLWITHSAVLGVQELIAQSLALATEATPLCDALAPHLGASLAAAHPVTDAGADLGSPHLPSPLSRASTETRFTAAYCQLCSTETFFDPPSRADGPANLTTAPRAPLPAALVLRVEGSLLSVSSEAFTQLCRYVHRGTMEHLVPSSVALSLVEALPHRLDSLTPRQLAWCVWGLGQLPDAGQRLSHQLTSEIVSDYVVDCADLFWSGPEIAVMLYGFARFHCTKRSLYSVFAERLSKRPVRATMDQTSVGLALSAFGMVKYLDKPLFDRFAASYAKYAGQLSAADLLMSVMAHSRVLLLNDGFYDAMGKEITQRADAFPFHAKCQLLDAYGSVGQENDPLAARLGSLIAGEVDANADANAAVDVLASLWLMHYDISADDKLQPLLRCVQSRSSQLTGHSVMKLCSILADSSLANASILEALGNRCVELKQSNLLSPEAARATLDVMAQHNYCHWSARKEMAALARTVSKEAPKLSEEEAEELKVMLSA